MSDTSAAEDGANPENALLTDFSEPLRVSSRKFEPVPLALESNEETEDLAVPEDLSDTCDCVRPSFRPNEKSDILSGDFPGDGESKPALESSPLRPSSLRVSSCWSAMIARVFGLIGSTLAGCPSTSSHLVKSDCGTTARMEDDEDGDALPN
jgi:hypothetical protein